MSAASFRRWLKLFAIAPLAGGPALVRAQLPPPDLVLTEPRPALLSMGPFDFHARAATTFAYDDNISLYERPITTPGIQTGRSQPPLGDDFIFTFTPGMIIKKATTLEDSKTAFSLDYSPAFVFFVKNDQENSIDQSLKFEGGYAFTKLTLGLVQEYVSTAGGVIDVGSRVSQENYRTALVARYELTEKTFLQGDGSFRINDYETLTDSEEWSAIPTINYQFSPKLTLGLGVTMGQLYVGEQSQVPFVTQAGKTNVVTKVTTRAQTYAGPTVRASYRTTEKTDVSLSLGGEWRFYPDGGSSFNPVFALTGTYRPVETTSLSLEAHRTEQNSAVLHGENFISMGVSLAARQQLRERLSGYFSIGFNNSDYKPTERGVRATRNDDYYLMRCGLDAIVGRSWTVGIFYQYRQDVSTDQNFSFDNNQVGIQASWAY